MTKAYCNFQGQRPHSAIKNIFASHVAQWTPKTTKLVAVKSNRRGDQGSTSQGPQPGFDEYPLPDPTRTFFLLPEPDPNYFSKFPSIGFFPVSCFPVGCFKSFRNGPQILLFSSCPDMKSSYSKSKCLDRRNGSKKNQKNLTIELWCILIYSSRCRGNQSINRVKI